MSTTTLNFDDAPESDMTTLEMKSARLIARQLIVQLVLLGYLTTSLLLKFWRPEPTDIDGLALSFLTLCCGVAGSFYWKELSEVSPGDVEPAWLVGSIALSALLGVAVALSYRWYFAGLIKALGQTYGGTTATITVIVAGSLALWLAGSLLARVMINRNSLY